MTESRGPETVSTLEVRVYYEDTDAGGVVYYANYLKFMERARTEWLRQLGTEQTQLAQDSGAIFVVRRVEVDYRRPARLDDRLIVESQISEVSKLTVTFSQRVMRDGELLVHGHIQICCVDATRFRPTPIPGPLHGTLTSLIQE